MHSDLTFIPTSCWNLSSHDHQWRHVAEANGHFVTVSYLIQQEQSPLLIVGSSTIHSLCLASGTHACAPLAFSSSIHMPFERGSNQDLSLKVFCISITTLVISSMIMALSRLYTLKILSQILSWHSRFLHSVPNKYSLDTDQVYLGGLLKRGKFWLDSYLTDFK